MTSIEHALCSSKKKLTPLKSCITTLPKIDPAEELSTCLGLRSDQFRFLFGKLPVAVALHKVKYNKAKVPVDFVTLAFNDAFEKLQWGRLGFNRFQIVNSSIQDFYPHITLEKTDWIDIIGKVAQSGKTEQFEIRDKRSFFHVTVYSPKKGYCFTSFMDITTKRLEFNKKLSRQQKIEEILQGGLERYRRLLKQCPVAICEVDYETVKIKNANEAMTKILGYSELEFLDLSLFDLLYPDSMMRFKDEITKATGRKKIVAPLEVQCKTKDGCGIYCVLDIQVLNRLNKPVGVLVAVHDITEGKKTQHHLKLAEKRFRLLYETTQDGIMARDLTGKMIACNSAYADMLGYSRKELKKISLEQLLPPKWRGQREQIITKEIQTGRSVVFEREYLRKDGSSFPASVRTWRLTDGKGKVVGLWSIVRDISEQKRLQHNLEEHADNLEKMVADRTKQLKDSERFIAIGQTAGMVGHDLRNPLQTLTGELYLVKSEVDTLVDGQVKDSLQESINVIEEQVAYMDKIVSDLQAFVQPIKIDKKPIYICSLAKEVLTSVAIPPNITVSIECAKGFPAVKVDPHLLRRVLVNLVTNAVQAMPDGGKLSLKASFNGASHVSFTVHDTGVGISESIKSQIFTPLFTTKPRGQGFGLAVCKRVMEAHGGTICFESTAGKGARFALQFPVD